MVVFNDFPSLQRMKEECVIQDDKYWKIELLEGETYLDNDDNKDYEFCVQTKEGFMIRLVFQWDGFHVFVEPPDDFQHDVLDIHRIFTRDKARLEIRERKYYWSYHNIDDATWKIPLEQQYYGCIVSGPVQMMETCRLLVREIIAKKHKTVEETFQRNLLWIKERCGYNKNNFTALSNFNLKLEKGESFVHPPHWIDRSLCWKTVDDFVITIQLREGPFRRYLTGRIHIPLHLFILEWMKDKRDYTSNKLNGIFPDLKVQLYKIYKDFERLSTDTYEFVSHEHFFLNNEERILSPKQVMEEAREIIKIMMRKEYELRRERKEQETKKIVEEMMMKACHPKRIQKWAEQGFDPFEES